MSDVTTMESYVMWYRHVVIVNAVIRTPQKKKDLFVDIQNVSKMALNVSLSIRVGSAAMGRMQRMVKSVAENARNKDRPVILTRPVVYAATIRHGSMMITMNVVAWVMEPNAFQEIPAIIVAMVLTGIMGTCAEGNVNQTEQNVRMARTASYAVAVHGPRRIGTGKKSMLVDMRNATLMEPIAFRVKHAGIVVQVVPLTVKVQFVGENV
jgi:hypothetical protein